MITIENARVQMPVMFPIGEEAVEAREDRLAQRDLALLTVMAEPQGSTRKWAIRLGVTKRAVEMTLKRLKTEKLIALKARRWTLTKDGERMVKEAEK